MKNAMNCTLTQEQSMGSNHECFSAQCLQKLRREETRKAHRVRCFNYPAEEEDILKLTVFKSQLKLKVLYVQLAALKSETCRDFCF